MASYLITGGCGFIGAHLALDLAREGHGVRVLDNFSTGSREKLPAGCELMAGDVADGRLVHECMQGMDGCFHLAAMASVPDFNGNWLSTHRTNQSGTINVLDAARRRKTPVVYASSAAVYGDNAEIPLTESSALRPLTAYGADKLGSELHARVAGLVHRVPNMGLRFFNVYGPGQDPASPYSGVISIFVDRLLRGETLIVYGDGQQTRDFIYVGDVVRFLRSAMHKVGCSPAVFNVCTGESVSINQLARSLMSILGLRLPIAHGPSRKMDIRVSMGDPSHAGRRLGISACHSLAEGLRLFIQHEQGERCEEVRVRETNPLQPSSQACFLR